MSDSILPPLKVEIVSFAPQDSYELANLAIRTSADTYGFEKHNEGSLTAIMRGRFMHDFECAVQTDTVLVAKLGSQIVGYTQFGKGEACVTALRSECRELQRLYVAPEVQSRRIGSQLMDAALDSPVLATAPEVFLWVWGENTRAINFYERYKFKEVAARYYVDSRGKRTHDRVMIRNQTDKIC